MSKEINDLLEDAIKTSFTQLGNLDPGSDERRGTVEELETLYKLSIDEKKLDLDAEAKIADRGLASETAIDEAKLKEAQLKDQKKDRYFRVGIEVAGIVLPLVFYGIWMKKGLKFEETGTFTSTTFRGLFNQFKTKNRG